MSAHFYKSTYSGSNGTCVEVARGSAVVLIRDSKYTGPVHSQPILTVPEECWAGFLERARSRTSGRVGELLTVAVHTEGGATLSDGQGVMLEYNADEWDAFIKGVADGQFGLTGRCRLS